MGDRRNWELDNSIIDALIRRTALLTVGATVIDAGATWSDVFGATTRFSPRNPLTNTPRGFTFTRPETDVLVIGAMYDDLNAGVTDEDLIVFQTDGNTVTPYFGGKYTSVDVRYANTHHRPLPRPEATDKRTNGSRPPG